MGNFSRTAQKDQMDIYLCFCYVLQSSLRQASMLTRRSAYIHSSTNRRQPIVKPQVLGYCLVHSPEKRSPVFAPNLCLLVIDTYGSELYGMESKDSR